MWVFGPGLFCLGAWSLQQQAQLPGLAWLMAFGALALLRWVGAGAWRGVQPVFDAVLWLGAGFLWAGLIAHGSLARQLPPEWESREIRVEGVVARMPQVAPDGVRFDFDIERVLTSLAPPLRLVELHWYSPHTVPRAGERWSLTLRLKRPRGLLNPHGFDREYWAMQRGVQAVGYVHGKAPAQRLDALVWRLQYLVERSRQSLRERVTEGAGGSPAAGVLAALAVGDQDAIASEQWQLFTRTGVGHLMSISGLHITMLSTLVGFVAGWAWRRSAALVTWMPARKAALVAGLFAAVIYASLAGFGVPAQRTVLMLAAMVAALLWARHWSASDVLAAALLAVLVHDPFSVMAPGFWLSFGAVALILYVSLGRLRTPSAIVQWLRVQGAMSLGLIPLTLLLFQQASLVSPLANAFAIPLVSLVVVPATLLGMLLPFDALLLLAAKLMEWCLAGLNALNQVHWATWQQPAPPAWLVALAMLGAVWSLAPRGFPARVLGLLAMLPALFVLAPAPREGEYWMDVLDVGQGLAVLLRTSRHNLLYDTGPAYGAESDAGERIVLPHLRASGVDRIDTLVVSHDDKDHSGGAAAILAGAEVGLLASSLPSEHGLVRAAPAASPCSAGQAWTWDGVRFEFLHPAAGAAGVGRVKDNDRSCVLRVQGHGGVTLLPGDIEARAERELLSGHPAMLAADVLLAPHHGSGTSSTTDFLAAVAPATVIVTSGYRNRHGHPRPEVLARYRQIGAHVLRTDRDGALLLRAVSSGILIQGWRDVHPRYWYD